MSKCGPMLSVWRCTRDICLASHPAWSPGPLCLYVYVVVVSDHFLRLLVIDLEKFSPFLIFSFAEFKPKHKKKKKLLLHTCIAYYYYNYFNVHTTERLPPPTRRFFMPQDYLQFLLSTRIIMQSLLLLLLLLTKLY